MYNNNPTRVLTGEVRLSYVNLVAPRANSRNRRAGQALGGVRPPVMPIPVHDGDGVRDNGTPYGPECKGCWVITASSKQKPQVVHQSDINTELAPQDIYSGMYARVTINFFGYNQAGRRGIGCGLGNVMKTREGEPLAGATSAAADFAGIGQTVAPSAQNPMGSQSGKVNPLTGQPYYG